MQLFSFHENDMNINITNNFRNRARCVIKILYIRMKMQIKYNYGKMRQEKRLTCNMLGELFCRGQEFDPN